MPTKITIIIGNPADVDGFETTFPQVASLAAELPKVQRVESAKVWPKEDGSPTPAHRTLDLYFESYDDASAAVQDPRAGQLFGGLAASGAEITGLFSDVQSA